jgi:hypothetical protein
MKTVCRWMWAALLVAAVLLAACGGDDDSNEITSDESYEEGSVRMQIETLDTGLLKGHSYSTAAEGWTVEEIHVTAVDEKGSDWPVIEIPEGAGADGTSLFFEVTIQELPRGEQVTITTVTTFQSDDGVEVERTAMDTWPP